MEKQKEKKRIKMKKNQEKGITLIALVITIIVLLILAGVTIATLTGENGILTKASKARKQTEIEEIREMFSLIWTECQSEYFVSNSIQSKEDFFTTDLLNKKIKEGTISDFEYNEDTISTLVYTSKNGERYYVEIGNEVVVYQDNSSIADLKDWHGCTACSEGNPHIISNKYEFESIRTHINTDEDGNEYIGGYFVLGNNIYFNSGDFEEGGYFYNEGNGFIPIGLKNGPYTDIFQDQLVYNLKIKFDGNGKEIKNIKINTTEQNRDYNAIFARLDSEGIIKSFCINNLKVSAPTSVACIVRSIYDGAEVSDVSVKNSECINTKYMGNMKSSGIIAGYIEGKVHNINIYNCSFVSKSWNGAGISGQISNSSDVNGIIMDKCNVETYVEGGMIAGTIRGGTRIKNINILNSNYTYTYYDSERAGLLFYKQEQENNANPVIFENLNIKNVKYNENLKKFVGKGYAELINSNIQLINDENNELIKENIILENSTIKY